MSKTLYRSVGLFELQLIEAADYEAFPPRLPEQPFFYPVLNQAYAEQIAREWNLTDPKSGYMGAVTAFDVDAAYLRQFKTQVVGNATHQELWVPAEQLADFNEQIMGKIRVVAAFYGERYEGDKRW